MPWIKRREPQRAPSPIDLSEAAMRSGLWFSFGLVLATTAVIVWRYLAAPWIIWLFARGD